MSEAFPGLAAPEVARPRAAAVVILWRQGPDGTEVFWVRRGEPLRFAGGFHAFPGGKLEDADQAVSVVNVASEDTEAPPAPAKRAAQVAGAVRELFEETGVLLARGADRVSAAERREARRALLDGTATWPELLARWGLTLDAALLTPAGRWITPPFVPVRFDTQFFLAALPAGESPEVWPGELSDGAFVRCQDALARWQSGEVLLHPPNRWALEVLARRNPTEAAAELAAPPYCEGFVARRLDFQPGLWLHPQRTPTLPPATHTNCYLVDRGDGLAVVDPGASEPDEQAALAALLREFADEGRPARELWLTHHHADHIGGVARLAAERQLPVRCHARTADRLPAGLTVRPIADSDEVAPGWRALHTPGHARGHLSFLHEPTGALLCGDMVSTLSTIVIDPPEGDMAEYLRQLERLRALAPRTLYPSHGPPAPNAVATLTAYVEHRQAREQKVLGALASGGTLTEITARAYDDTPAFLHPVAERSCLASLEKLEAEGRARRDGERFSPTPTR